MCNEANIHRNLWRCDCTFSWMILLPLVFSLWLFLVWLHSLLHCRLSQFCFIFILSVFLPYNSYSCSFLNLCIMSFFSLHPSFMCISVLQYFCTLNLSLVSLTFFLRRLQCRSHGGRPWQAAGVLRDPLRLFTHGALSWSGKWWRLQQQCCQFGSFRGHAAQRWAGSSQAVCPSGDHSAGHSQHRLWEVRPNTDV